MIKNFLPSVWRRSESSLRRAEDHPFFALQREINEMFDDFFRGFDLAPFGETRWAREFVPSVDVREDEKEVIVKAELPGMDEKDIDVSLADDILTIKGEKKEEKEDKGKDFYRREIRCGAFNRAIQLPSGLDTDKAEARFKNGVLTITLPKLEEAKEQRKKIAIKTE